MIGDFNKIIASGFISSAPKNVSKDESKKWIGFKLEVSERYEPSGEIQKCFFDVLIFDKINANFAIEQLKVGDKVGVEGKLMVKMKKQKDGQEKQQTTIVNGFGNVLILLHSPSASNASFKGGNIDDDELPF